jgi:acyl-CoA synthetase (AMP-forming)/AMP-acid ligase II
MVAGKVLRQTHMNGVRNLADLVRRSAATNGDKTAIISEETSVSYRQLDERSNRVANLLLARGLQRGDLVGYLSKNRPEFFDILFGVAKAGGATTTVNWRLAEAEVGGVLADARPRFLFADPELVRLFDRASLKEIGVSVIDLPTTIGGWLAFIEQCADTDPMLMIETNDTMYQLYTSGTTGKPKGVMLTNGNLFGIAEALADSWHFDKGSVVYNPYPVFHGAGILWVLLTMLRDGLVVFKREFDVVDVLTSIEKYRVNLTLMVPTVLSMVLNHETAATADLSSLRNVIYGVAPITQTLLNQAIERLPQCAFHHAYGSTESTGTITTMQWDEHRPGTERMRSVGRPFPWVELRVVDPETRLPLGVREVGEVAVRGSIVMKGYYHNSAETARVVDEGGWLYTGDAGFLDEEGFLYLTDRIKDMIISGGENIYPAEVENVICSMPGVREAAVIGVPVEKWGEKVLAFVVPHLGSVIDPAAVIEFTRKRLAHYKCPREVVIRHEPLPLNPTGKVLRRVLREPYWHGKNFKI